MFLLGRALVQPVGRLDRGAVPRRLSVARALQPHRLRAHRLPVPVRHRLRLPGALHARAAPLLARACSSSRCASTPTTRRTLRAAVPARLRAAVPRRPAAPVARDAAGALVVLLATLAPVGVFFYRAPDRSARSTSAAPRISSRRGAVRAQAERFVRLLPAILLARASCFERGDPIVPPRGARLRRAATVYAALRCSSAPASCLCAATAASKLFLWWLRALSGGAGLMTEIPAPSRGIIGAPALLPAGRHRPGGGAARARAGWRTGGRSALAVQAAALAAAAAVSRCPQVAATCTPTSSTTPSTRPGATAASSTAIATSSTTWRASASKYDLLC